MRPVLDVSLLVQIIEIAIREQDLNGLASLAGIFVCLGERCKAAVAVTLGGSVPSLPNSGRLLTVHEAASVTGLPASFFYRNSSRIPALRRPSKGRIRFEEAALIKWATERRQ